MILCYELSDQEALTVHQVKAHDVRDIRCFQGLPISLSLEFTQHLHVMLHEGSCLCRFRALSLGTYSHCSADPPVAHGFEEPSTYVNFCTYINAKKVIKSLKKLNSSLSSPTSEQVCKNRGGNVSIVPGNRLLVTSHNLTGFPDLKVDPALENFVSFVNEFLTYPLTKR